jgi:hypothetical protein
MATAVQPMQCCVAVQRPVPLVSLACKWCTQPEAPFPAGPQGQERQDEAGAGAAHGAGGRARHPERHAHPEQPGGDARPVRLRLRGAPSRSPAVAFTLQRAMAQPSAIKQQRHQALGTPSVLLQGLLGDARRFKDFYSRPIEAGNDRHATQRMRQVLRCAAGSSCIAEYVAHAADQGHGDPAGMVTARAHRCSGGGGTCGRAAGNHSALLPAPGEGQCGAHTSKVCADTSSRIQGLGRKRCAGAFTC